MEYCQTLVNEAVEEKREDILKTERYIWEHAEAGYREWQSDAWMRGQFESMGYTVNAPGDIPGFYADLHTDRPGPTIAVLAELDALVLPSHPRHNPETGCAHACGHHGQLAYLVGVAHALKNPGVLAGLCGRVRFVVVPAEELIEIGFREELRARGVIKYFGGKVEFLRRGFFDGVDMAIMCHTGGEGFSVYPGNNGCVTKRVLYHGRAAHAAGSPQSAINALYAANLGMQAINALRETFYEEDYTRVHPIITKGGGAVNIIPDEVVLESYVRGATVGAIERVNGSVNRALAAAAAAMGATATLCDRPGYMPLHNDKNLNDIAAGVISAVLGGGKDSYVNGDWSTGSTDMGDLSCVMPVLHMSGGGGRGQGHGIDYETHDPETACVTGAKIVAGIACALLCAGGAEARRVAKEADVPYPTRQAYFDAVDAFYANTQSVQYQKDGSITLRYKA